MQCRSWFKDVVRKWDATQVELHGQYSIERFEALLRYEDRYTCKYRACVLALLTALPCLVFVVSIDALPLVPASEGIPKQTFACWFRVFMLAWSMSFTLTLGMCTIAPRLPMSTLRLCILSTTIAGTLTAIAFGSALLVGFPVPFALEFQAAPFAMLLASVLWFSWKDVLRKDTSTRQSLKRYVFVLITQVVMLQTYIGFTLVFNQLQGHNQTFLCVLLPLIKIIFKNCVGWATFHLEDLSPTIVIFTVDVYHALFVSLTMQQASTIGANIVVVVLDMVQNCTAYQEISKVLTVIDTLADEDKSTSNSTERSRYSASDIRLKVSVIDYAGYLLKSVRRVRESPEISLPRHLRAASDRSRRRSSVEAFTESRRMSSTRISPILEHSSFDRSSVPPTEEKRISRIFHGA